MTKQTSTIPKGWKMTTLGEVADFSYGKMPDVARVTTDGEFPVFSGYRISGYYDEFNSDEDLIVVARGVGGTGDVKISPPKSFLTNLSIIIKLDDTKAYKKYLYYKYSINNLRYLDSGTAQSQIVISDLKNIQLIVPPLPEQRAIAAVLSSLDDKIELLREQNKTLEATAQAIFKEWFVDFHFPNATGKMIDSELGEIPEGWRVGTVNDVIERFTITYRCDQDDLSIKGKTPIIDQGTSGLYGYTEREPDFQASTENPVILFTNHTCNMWFVNYPFCAIQNVIPFRGNSEYSSFFVFYMTLGRVKFIEYKGHWPDFEHKQYIIPTPAIANEFAKIVKPLQYKIWNNGSQTQTLSVLRDALLPKLMKGEVRVRGFKD